MVRTRLYISLLLFAACAVSIGCNPGITPPPPIPVTDAAKYFWNGTMAPVSFSDIDSSGVRKSTFSLSFYSGDSNTFIIKESNSNSSKPDSLICSVNGDAVNIKGLSPHSILPIPDGYAVKPKLIINQHNVAPLSFKHILAVPDISVVATTETGVYYSVDSGLSSWTQLNVPFGSNRDTVTALTYIGTIVFAATSSGNIYLSSNSGAKWTQSSVSLHDPILAIASDPPTYSLFISAGQSVYRWVINGTSQPIRIPNNSAKRFTSLAFSVDSIDSNILVGGTVDAGLWYTTIGSKDSAWHQVTNTTEKNASIKSLISTSQGFYCSTTDAILFSEPGMSWKPLPLNIQSAILTYDSRFGQVIAGNRGGSILKISDDITHKIITSTPRIPSTSVNDISALYPNYYAATDSGIFRLTNGGQTWQPIFGRGGSFADTTKLTGEVSLLHSVTGINSSDSSWAADTLISTYSKTDFPITARLIDHFNSITMPDSTSYNDVIEVQYTAGAANQLGIPAGCQIFYAKDVGPIIIREIIGSAVLRKIYRLKN